MKLCKGVVISNNLIAKKHYHLIIDCPEIADKIKEGQIVHIRCSKGLEPLLRRPFSIYRFDRKNGIIEFVYLVKGKGTKLMSKMEKGDEIDLLGPGGNSYEIPTDTKGIAIFGRGVGIASIVSLAERAKQEGHHVTVILSAKTESLIFAHEFLESIDCDVYSLSDEKGTSDVDDVRNILSKAIDEKSVNRLYTCGSNRIARLMRDLGGQHGISAFVSLEEYMACGIGVCHGCVCKTKDGYKTVCKDGPIFDVNEVTL